MLKRLVMAGLAATLVACTPPLSVKQAFAQCQVEDRRAKGTAGADADVLSACMEAHGFEVMGGYCSVTASPDRIEGCYRRVAR